VNQYIPPKFLFKAAKKIASNNRYFRKLHFVVGLITLKIAEITDKATISP